MGNTVNSTWMGRMVEEWAWKWERQKIGLNSTSTSSTSVYNISKVACDEISICSSQIDMAPFTNTSATLFWIKIQSYCKRYIKAKEYFYC